jgi:hypothetical protein
MVPVHQCPHIVSGQRGRGGGLSPVHEVQLHALVDRQHAGQLTVIRAVLLYGVLAVLADIEEVSAL